MIQSGAFVGAWRLVSPLGSGASGSVWRARDAGGRVCALKVTTDGNLADLEALSRVCHPAIPGVIDAGRAPVPFVAMELAHGRTLGDVLAGKGRLGLQDALHVTAVVADALAALHSAGMTHNDVKPANIVVHEDLPRRVFLVDLGLAGGEGGTLSYAAPERTSGEGPSETSDVYSLGLVLWEMLFGGLPWPELSRAEAVVRRRRSAPEAEHVPPWLKRLFSELLAVRPGERPPARRVVDTLSAHDIRVPAPDAALLERRARAVHVERPELADAVGLLGRRGCSVAVVGRPGAGCSHFILREWRERVAGGQHVLMLLSDGTPWGAVTTALTDPHLPGPPATLPREASFEARAAVAAELIRARVDGPLCVLFDDWHVADMGTRLTAERLAMLPGVHMMIAGASAPQWADHEVQLRPLDDAGIADLVAGVLGQRTGLEPMLEACASSGAVLPGAVRATVVTAAQVGGIVFRKGRWVCVPDVLGSLAARVPARSNNASPLTGPSRRVAEVLGAARGPLSRAALREMLGLDEPAICSAVDALTCSELVIAEADRVRPVSASAATAMAPRGEGAVVVHRRLLAWFASCDPVPLERMGRHVVEARDVQRAQHLGPEIVASMEATDPQEAASVGRALLRLSPGTAIAVAVVGALVAAGKVAEARRIAASVLAEAPAGPELVPVHLALARLSSAHDQCHDEALGHIVAALELAGDTADLPLQEVRAQVLYRAGQHAEAVEVARAAMRRQPQGARDEDAWIGLATAQAQALEAAGQLDAAVELLAGLPPDIGVGRSRRALAAAALGRLRWLQGDPHAACGSLEEAVRPDAGLGALDRARASLNLGTVLFQMGERARAFAAWESAELLFERLRAREDQVRVAVNLTVGYGEAGRWEDARQTGHRALVEARDAGLVALEAMAAGNLGDVAMATNQHDKAGAWFERATQLAEVHELVSEKAELARRRAELAIRSVADDALELAERACLLTEGMPAEHARAAMLWQVARARAEAPADVMGHLEVVAAPLSQAGDQGGLAWARFWAAEAAAEAELLVDARELVEGVCTWAVEVGHAELATRAGALRERLRAPAASGAERVLELAGMLARETDLDRLLSEVARASCELVDADRACVVISGEPLQHAAFSGEVFEPSSSVLHAVLQETREVLAIDLGDRADIRLRSSVHAMELRSVLCVPILDRGEILGALYADSRTASRRQLTESVGLMRGLANLAGSALVRVRSDALRAASLADRAQVARLEEADAVARVQAVELEGRNAELVELNRALAAAADAERAASETRARFLAMMSHEFRTPMNGVLGMVDLLEALPASPEQLQHLGVIRRSGEFMLGMVERVLAASRLESGAYELETAPFDLGDTCGRVLEQVRFSEHARGLSLRLDLQLEEEAVVAGDEGALQQVLFNLLGNAVRFTDQGGVALRVRRVGERVCFEVSDTGVGIAPADQQRIFEAFVQVREQRRGGTGLGLSITAELVDLMGGTIGCSSVVGVGTIFEVDLPLPCVAPARSPQIRVEAAPRFGHRVLVVEDNPVNMMVAVRQLKSLGCVTDEATSCAQALARAAEGGPYDLFLLDWELGDGTAADVARGLREVRGCQEVPKVVLTAHSGAGARFRSLDAGLDDHMLKPLRREELASVLRRWLLDRVGPPLEGRESPRAPQPIISCLRGLVAT